MRRSSREVRERERAEQRAREAAEREAEEERKRRVISQWMTEHEVLPLDEWEDRLQWVDRIFEFIKFFHVVVLNQEGTGVEAYAMLGKCLLARVRDVSGIWSILLYPESQKILDENVTEDTELYQNWRDYAELWEPVAQEVEEERARRTRRRT